MQTNVGGIDRDARAALAISALSIGLFAPMRSWARLAVLAVAGSAVFTAFTGYCPLNQALGINTADRHPILLPEHLS